MKVYTVARKIDQTYGHGNYGVETHICQKDAYSGDKSFHPVFENEKEAKRYISKLDHRSGLFTVE